MTHSGRFDARWTRRGIVLACLLLVLVFAGLEAVHSHADANPPGRARSCAVCVTVHSNAPAVTVYPLPTLRTVAMVAAPFLAQGKGISQELSLFIRPPPLF